MALLLVNTVNLPGPAGLDRPLAEGDIVAFVPPMAGG
jgi:molybdopterin converting factor small subunit